MNCALIDDRLLEKKIREIKRKFVYFQRFFKSLLQHAKRSSEAECIVRQSVEHF